MLTLKLRKRTPVLLAGRWSPTTKFLFEFDPSNSRFCQTKPTFNIEFLDSISWSILYRALSESYAPTFDDPI